jgi:hypothetical protein
MGIFGRFGCSIYLHKIFKDKEDEKMRTKQSIQQKTILISVGIIAFAIVVSATILTGGTKPIKCIKEEIPFLKVTIIDSGKFKPDPNVLGIWINLKIENVGDIPTSADGKFLFKVAKESLQRLK